ncbi:MAG: hypothetical protein HRU20_01885 [Pseudomonadales bacterium]|nr:hypothetical protein [Pseudomonadales bacterium]
MHQVTFRFVTECELTFAAESYEEAYMQFIDFQRGEHVDAESVQLMACPPETDAVYFKLEGDTEFHEISHFKGDFKADMGAYTNEVMGRH